MKENQNNKIEAPVEPTISLDAVYEDLQSLPDYTEEELRQIIQKELKKPARTAHLDRNQYKAHA